MNSMKSILMAAREAKNSAFIPFIMAGDPDMETCEEIILALHKSGAKILELGIPFSDPAADGITVQRAAERALAQGTTVQSTLSLVKRLREKGVTMPICLFSYLNPVYQVGYDNFITQSLAAGVNGALLVDLPPEEAEEYCTLARKHDFETVFLCSPTTSPERMRLLDDCSSGFVYYVSREGVTGTQNALPAALEQKLTNLRQTLQNPFVVGFGISQPEHIQQLNGRTDGIVVGSALIKLIEENPKDSAVRIPEKVRFLT